MIDFPVIDAHVHLWDTEQISYPWLKDVPSLNRSFLLSDYDKACGGLEVEKIVFMQCECDPSQYRQEVAWVTQLAETEPRIQGIVAWAPLEKGDHVRQELEELKANPLVKGIRRIIQFEPDPDFCLQPDFIKGVNLLKEFELTFDICIAHIHNKSVLKMLEKCKDVPMILDHIGKPDIKNRKLEPWRDEIREMARFDNVYCKLSSLATEADHQNWKIHDLRPYVEHIIDCFGSDRLIYASDWPVSSQAADIPTCVLTTAGFLQEFTGNDLQKVFRHNAQKFYRL
jgi:L-fuconolactonase